MQFQLCFHAFINKFVLASTRCEIRNKTLEYEDDLDVDSDLEDLII